MEKAICGMAIIKVSGALVSAVLEITLHERCRFVCHDIKPRDGTWAVYLFIICARSC